MLRSRFTTIMTMSLLTVAACSDPTTPVSAASRSIAALPFSNEPATLGWQARARALVGAGNLSPLAAGRIYAAMSVAQYRAVAAVNEQLQTDGTLSDDGFGIGGRSLFEAQRAAIAAASARVLSFFFPNAAGSLDQQVLTEANAGAGSVHPQFARGVQIGRAAGDALIQHVQNDRFTTPWTGTVPAGPGMWVANGPPAGATLGGVTPYFMTSGSQFRPAPPPSYLSAEFNTGLNEVLTFAQNRTPAQIANAVFWNYGTGTPTPPGYFNEVAAAYSIEQRLDETATAHVFALMHAAVFDALIACWDAKYYYWLIRPSQANPAITLALGLPNHPSYPSGHSCVSAAAGTVLTHFFPSHAGDISSAVADAGLSRIVAGIHYRFDITAGNGIGNAVGQLAIDRDF